MSFYMVFKWEGFVMKYFLYKTVNKFCPFSEKVMMIGHRSGEDRRSSDTRRKIFDKNYFIKGGVEKRRHEERRQKSEQRNGWVRVGNWKSALKLW